jgi:hypothetical protein
VANESGVLCFELSRLSERLGISPNSPSFIASYFVVHNFDFSQFEVAHESTTPLISVASVRVILLGLAGHLERALSSTHESQVVATAC